MQPKKINWKAVGKRLLFLPFWLIVLLTVICTALLVAVFVMGYDSHPIAYAVYVLSFYTLTTLCAWGWFTLPTQYKKLRQKIADTKYGNRYLTDVTFKTHVSLYRSLAINLLYVAVNVISGLVYRSAWFGILAVYYTILALMRFLLVRYVHAKGIGTDLVKEFRRSRLCGIILMLINLTLSGAVLMILYQDRGYEYHGILIYVMAMYTFYVTVHSIVDTVRYRKYNSPVMSTAKIISLTAALVSMLSLETAMLTEFGGDMSLADRRLMIALTGAGVSVTVITLAVYMIVRANIHIKRLTINNSQTKSY